MKRFNRDLIISISGVELKPILEGAAFKNFVKSLANEPDTLLQAYT